MFAVGVFGLVAIGAIGIMNKGLYDAQKALEITMARQEIDAQAESLRFIHEAYLSEKNNHDLSVQIYTKIWSSLKTQIYRPSDTKLAHFFDSYNGRPCSTIYANNNAFPARSNTSSTGSSLGAAPFIINYRRLDETTAASFMNISANGNSVSYSSPSQASGSGIIVYRAYSASLLEETPVYPRLLYSNIYNYNNNVHDIDNGLSDRDVDETSGRDTNKYYNTLTKAQGIWVVGIASDDSTNPEFYDFHIRTCWTAPGSTDSTTISTTVRLFNPDYRP